MPEWVDIGGVPIYINADGTPAMSPTFSDPAGEYDPQPVSTPEPEPAPAPSFAGPIEAEPMFAPSDPYPVAMPPGASQAAETRRGGSAKVSMSSRGINERTAARNKKGSDAILAGAPAAAAAHEQALMGQAAGFGDVTAMAEEAVGMSTEAQALQAEAKAQGQRSLAELNDRQAAASQRVHEVASQRSQKYRADFERSLAEYQAAEVDPSRLWSNMPGAMKFSTMIAAFVTDFLGAKGIKTSAMDSFNAAVERDIAAQVENIRKQGQATDMFRNLWDMSMREGATEAEAVDRIHAYHLAGAEKAIAAEVLKYDSDLARANGAAQIAQLRESLHTKLAGLQDKAYERAQADVNRALNAHFENRRLALQSASVSMQREALELDKIKAAMAQQGKGEEAALKAAGELNERIVVDPNNPDQIIGAARTKEQANKIREQLSGKAALVEQIAKVRDGLNGASLYNGPLSEYIKTPEGAKLEGDYYALLGDYRRMQTGAVANQTEMAEMKRTYPIETTLTNRDIWGTYNDNLDREIRRVDKEIRGEIGQLTAGDEALIAAGYVTAGANYDFAADRKGETEIRKIGQVTVVDKALEGVTAPDSRKRVKADGEVLKDWEAATGDSGVKISDVGDPYNKNKTSARVPKFAKSTRELYEIAVKPESPAGARDYEEVEAQRARALEHLANLATTGDIRFVEQGADAWGKPRIDSYGNQDQAALAQYYLYRAAEYYSSKGMDVDVPRTDDERVRETVEPGGSY
jgi:hypothetical protein